MKIGFCAKPDQAAAVAAAGFDYIEPPVNFIAGMSEADFQAAREALREANLPAPSFNLLFPCERTSNHYVFSTSRIVPVNKSPSVLDLFLVHSHSFTS